MTNAVCLQAATIICHTCGSAYCGEHFSDHKCRQFNEEDISYSAFSDIQAHCYQPLTWSEVRDFVERWFAPWQLDLPEESLLLVSAREYPLNRRLTVIGLEEDGYLFVEYTGKGATINCGLLTSCVALQYDAYRREMWFYGFGPDHIPTILALDCESGEVTVIDASEVPATT